jgi:ABC-type branched-subunit amino acid transport system substrate-binding protein
MTGFERCAWLWNETNAFVEKFRRERGSDRTITIRSEDLFKDASVMLQIVEHCGLPPLSMEEIRRALARPVNAQGKSNQAPPYAQWDEETKEQVRRWAALADHYEYAL